MRRSFAVGMPVTRHPNSADNFMVPKTWYNASILRCFGGGRVRTSSRITHRRIVSMGQLSGKVAAVTGGASGIGEATVRRFIAEGAQVAFADRDVERGQRVAAEIEASGGHVVFVETHVEQEAEVAAFMQSAVDHFGQLNILVNNAGIRMYHTVVEASAESWNTILGVNLMGYVFGAKAAIPALRQAG